ncbi:Crossover junction endonuclease mus81 [Dimargaris cristalligena]|nr:Crossover junction endonuclease mus81 [Dimargaris cristalligena]
MPPRKVLPPCANPLFLEWIDTWIQEARSRQSKLQFVYRKAYDAMLACPECLNSAQEAKRLNGIGDALVTRLQTRLDKHYLELGQTPPSLAASVATTNNTTATTTTSPGAESAQTGTVDARPPRPPTSNAEPAPRRRRTAAEYVPRYRSGAFSILIALHLLTVENRCRHPRAPVVVSASTSTAASSLSPSPALSDPIEDLPEVWFAKNDIIRLAQNFCDATFDLSARGNQYTAWSTMKTLVDRELVYRFGNAGQYMLSAPGEVLALKMFLVTRTRDTDLHRILTALNLDADGRPLDLGPTVGAEIHPTRTTGSGSHSRSMGYGGMTASTPAAVVNLQDKPVRFSPQIHAPGSYSVVLLLDTREIRSRTDRDFFRVELEKRQVPVVLRSLTVGDIMWVARPNQCSGSDEELFLEHIVERKRMDDLIASIKDGRYQEQKNRLRSCGAERVTYLVEGNHSEEDRWIGPATIQTAISETQTIHGFAVKRTPTIEASLDYLALMTSQLQKYLEPQALHQVPDVLVAEDGYQWVPLKDALQAAYPEHTWCLSYAALSNMSTKSGHLTLGELFIKMLMSARGMSAEKATHLAKRYRTPAQ